MKEQGWIDLPAALLESQMSANRQAANIISCPEYQDMAVEIATQAARSFFRDRILRPA